MERLQGESMEASSPPDSDCSPSNLNTQAMTFTRVVIFNYSNDKKHEKKVHLRDGILSEGQILDKNVQTLIFFIQKLPHPPTQRQGTESRTNSYTDASNNDQ